MTNCLNPMGLYSKHMRFICICVSFVGEFKQRRKNDGPKIFHGGTLPHSQDFPNIPGAFCCHWNSDSRTGKILVEQSKSQENTKSFQSSDLFQALSDSKCRHIKSRNTWQTSDKHGNILVFEIPWSSAIWACRVTWASFVKKIDIFKKKQWQYLNCSLISKRY